MIAKLTAIREPVQDRAKLATAAQKSPDRAVNALL
jgi:hypothetical protein